MGLKATDDVSLDLRQGEIHALIGPNGAGKTTLIHQVCGGIRPDAGSIRFLGQDVLGLGVSARARLGLGRTFQISSLALEFSALRNVMLAVQGRQGSSFRFFANVMADRSLTEPAMAALDRVGLGSRARPRGRTVAWRAPPARDRHRACAGFPRAAARRTDGGHGAGRLASLTRLLDTLRDEAPILLVEHDMDAVFALADRISVLVYGRIIASGTVDEIRNNPDVRQAYLGAQA